MNHESLLVHSIKFTHCISKEMGIMHQYKIVQDYPLNLDKFHDIN